MMARRSKDNTAIRLTILERLSITGRLSIGLAQAAIYKRRHSMAHVKLPRAQIPRTDNPDELSSLIQQVMRKADVLVNLFFYFTKRKCFFRSYAAACVLRHLGIEVDLNIGLHHLNQNHQSIRGHSWLTWQGRPIVEEIDPQIRYDRFIGSNQEGICYWIGRNHTDTCKIARSCKLEQEMRHAA